MEPLTKVQYETLRFMKRYNDEHGYMPLNVDIANEFHIKLGGPTTSRLKQLVIKGYLERTKGPRGYRLIQENVTHSTITTEKL